MINRQQVYKKFNGLCAYTGQPLPNDWQVDHIIPPFYMAMYNRSGDENLLNNLMPTLKIVNHYKRDRTLEQFREFMHTFHIRLKKLPKKTVVERTKKRIVYLNKVAEAFGITVDKPFDGLFYFEKIKNNICAETH